MDIHHYSNEFPYIIIDDLYDNHELQLIWEELDFLCYPGKLLPADKTAAAFHSNDILLKKNSALFLYEIYVNSCLSNILNTNRKIDKNYSSIFESSPSWFFNQLEPSRETVLLSYYEDSDYYDYHKDSCIATILTWFYKEPKSFSGGDLKLKYKDTVVDIEVKNNRCLIIPSFISHKVDTIHMEKDMIGKKMGRFCMAQFLHRD